MPTQGSEKFGFGPFEFDPQTGQLLKHGHSIKLQPKSAAVLECLLEFPGEIVNREQLKRKLWPAGTYVDFELGIKVAVKKLRDALGDSSDNPHNIQTIHGQGYRFIAKVTKVAEAAPGNGELATQEEILIASVRNEQLGVGNSGLPAASARFQPKPDLLPTGRRWKGALVLSAGILTAIVLVGPVAWRLAQISPVAAHPVGEKLISVPIITYADGGQWLPAFSPDGSRVAYSREAADGWHLEVKPLGSETQLQLTKRGAGFPPGPTWSPDGREIAYVRAGPLDDRGIFITSAMGGRERKLRSLHCGGFPSAY